jgi:hypothetical protein
MTSPALILYDEKIEILGLLLISIWEDKKIMFNDPPEPDIPFPYPFPDDPDDE